MAITVSTYGAFLTGIGTGKINLLTDGLSIILLKPDYVPDLENDILFDNVVGYEVADDSDVTGGYVGGGQDLANRTFVYDPPTKNAVLTADPVSWSALNADFRYAVVYRSSPGYKTLISCIDFATTRSYHAEPFQASFPDGVVILAGG